MGVGRDGVGVAGSDALAGVFHLAACAFDLARRERLFDVSTVQVRSFSSCQKLC